MELLNSSGIIVRKGSVTMKKIIQKEDGTKVLLIQIYDLIYLYNLEQGLLPSIQDMAIPYLSAEGNKKYKTVLMEEEDAVTFIENFEGIASYQTLVEDSYLDQMKIDLETLDTMRKRIENQYNVAGRIGNGEQQYFKLRWKHLTALCEYLANVYKANGVDSFEAEFQLENKENNDIKKPKNKGIWKMIFPKQYTK